MEFNIKHQQGFLLISAVVLIVIMTFIGAMLVHIFSGGTAATTNITQSQQALYIASSGLEIAKRDIVINSVPCININGIAKYTDATLLNGRFTVTGVKSFATSTLASTINGGSTIITLTNASNFANSGIVRIDNELIGYLQKSGDNLSQLTRGKAGSPITDHASSATVVQNQCVLTAVGGVPTIAAPTGKRTIQEILSGSTFSLGSYTPTLISGGAVTTTGSSSVINPSVTVGGPGYEGSTIVSAGAVEIKGSSTTQVSDGAGGLVTSSDKNTSNPDVVANYTMPADLFTYFFSDTKANIKASSDNSYTTPDSLNDATNKTIWYDGDLKFTGGADLNIGTLTAPVILIVDGDFSITSSQVINFYGVLYVTGTIKVAGGGNFHGAGVLISEGDATDFAGSATKNFNPTILASLPSLNPTVTTHYAPYSAGFFETFS